MSAGPHRQWWSGCLAWILAVGALVCTPTPLRASGGESKLEQALERFQDQDYEGAIALVRWALLEDPDDAELHYRLAQFLHYLCYDSVPLVGFDSTRSDEILEHLERAVELDPGLGDAYYFLGAEFGARARFEMQMGRDAGVAEELRRGHEAGGYPDWLLEAMGNTLGSCMPDAILFVGGDAEGTPLLYLQQVRGIRPDVSVIPLALLDRPWYLRLLKQGGDGLIRPVEFGWNEEQIDDLRPYKWKTRSIGCDPTQATREVHGLEKGIVRWESSPDLGRDGKPSLLSGGRAALMEILVRNCWERPVQVSFGISPGVWNGLEERLQLRGFTRVLLPTAAESPVDLENSREMLLEPQAYASVDDYREHPMPRAVTVLENQRNAMAQLAYQELRAGDPERAAGVLQSMEQLMPESIVPLSDSLAGFLRALRSRISEP